METDHLIDPAFWSSRRPVAPGTSFDPSGQDEEGLAGLVFFRTSGSTGEPRWVGLSREALLLSAAVVNRHLEVDERSCWGLVLPLNHVGGFGVVARAYEAGSRLCVSQGKWDPSRFSEWLATGGVTHVSLVPTQVHDLVLEGLRPPPGLRAVVVGGGVFSGDAGQSARELGWPVLASYGMTEAGSQIATEGLEVLEKPYEIGAIPLLPHWEARTEDDGRLSIKSPALFSGELVPADSGHRFHRREGEWFVTQDLGRVEPDGLVVAGRADLSVKILGELVDLEEVERKLDRVTVVALPDSRKGHRLVAVLEEGADLKEAESRLRAYNGEVEGFRRVDGVYVVESIPRSGLGKVKRAALADLLANQSI